MTWSSSRLFGTILCAMVIVGACDAGGPPALSVSSIEFQESELSGLSPALRMRLGELTAFGIAVASGDLPAVTAPVRRAREEARLVDFATAERVLEHAGISDANLRAEYSLDPAYELTVRHLIVLSPRWEGDETRGAARDKASTALARIQAGEDFPAVAAEISEEPGAEGRQGLLEPGRQGAWVGEFWSAALSLDVGAISPVVETQYGFHVLRLENRTAVPFDEERPSVAMQMAQRIRGLPGALHAWTDSMEVGVTFDEGRLQVWTNGAATPPTVLAQGSGGPLTAARLDGILTGLGDDAVRTAHSQGGRQLLLQIAALEGALSYAREIGVRLPTEATTTIDRNIQEITERWAAAFGFEPGMSEELVKETARVAFSASRQGATIARDELTLLAPSLREQYTIRLLTPEGGTPGV